VPPRGDSDNDVADRTMDPRAIRRIAPVFAHPHAGPPVCILLSSGRMSSPLRVVVVTCALLATTAASHAEPLSITHVRSTSREIGLLIADAAERSSSFHALVDRLEQSDVIVYVRAVPLNSLTIEGRLRFMSAVGGVRYVLVEIGCARPLVAQLATLAHELYHAVEIASAPGVVDVATMAAHYERIGDRMDMGLQVLTFETEGAHDMGVRVRRELLDRRTTTNDR
jgi:hypothetical protein